MYNNTTEGGGTMETISLDNVLKNIYEERASFIREKNIKLEREYFTKNSNHIPMNEIMQGASYEDHFNNFKNLIKTGNADEISQIFMLLQEYFLFSAGNDMMFKKKLEADVFTSLPMDNLIYSKLTETVKERYNDISVMKENPNFKENINGINRIVFMFMEMQSLLYLLYWNEFQFPNGWQGLYPDSHEEIINILNDLDITIGDFLHALIEFKCQIMKEIFMEINDVKLKQTYLEKVETLRKERQEEVKQFAHATLPVTYFLNHTILDFMNRKQKSSLFEEPSNSGAKKILLPKN